MAMTKCHECNHQISKKAKVCPSCGAPKKKKTSLFTWLVLIIIVISVFNVITSPQKTAYTPSSDNVEVKKDDVKQGLTKPKKETESSINRTAPSQDSITATGDPEAFNISSCVKASYYAHDFSLTEWEKASAWRYAMFEKLGVGRYAPNGKFVVANYNLYESTQGKKSAAEHVWETFNCSEHI